MLYIADVYIKLTIGAASWRLPINITATAVTKLCILISLQKVLFIHFGHDSSICARDNSIPIIVCNLHSELGQWST